MCWIGYPGYPSLKLKKKYGWEEYIPFKSRPIFRGKMLVSGSVYIKVRSFLDGSRTLETLDRYHRFHLRGVNNGSCVPVQFFASFSFNPAFFFAHRGTDREGVLIGHWKRFSNKSLIIHINWKSLVSVGWCPLWHIFSHGLTPLGLAAAWLVQKIAPLEEQHITKSVWYRGTLTFQRPGCMLKRARCLEVHLLREFRKFSLSITSIVLRLHPDTAALWLDDEHHELHHWID